MSNPSTSTDESAQAPGTPANRPAWWRLPLLLALVLAALVVWVRGIRQVPAPPGPQRAAPRDEADTGAEAEEPVSLTVDFGDGERREFPAIDWSDGMTVADALSLAGGEAGGDWITTLGTGEMAFLARIGQRSNEGAGGRNWIYSVNGQRGDRSFAVYHLQPGDRVLWEFAPHE